MDNKDNATKKNGAAAKATAPASGRARSGLPTPAWLGVAAACLVVGALAGQLLLGGPQASGKATLTKDELGTTVATYTYNGRTEKVTAQEAIEATTQLEKAKAQDGTYRAPSAKSVLSCARAKVVAHVVEEEGVSATDDEAKAYAKQQLGTDDLDVIAKKYGLKKENVERQLKQSVSTKKLYDKVVGPTDLKAPAAPQKDKDAATYGTYIVGLLGKEWDSSKNAWASTDGAYCTALGKDFSPDKATYEQATKAYGVAGQKYKAEYAKLTAKWSSFLNERLSKASIQLATLAS